MLLADYEDDKELTAFTVLDKEDFMKRSEICWLVNLEHANWMVKSVPSKNNNLTKDSSADCFQVYSLSQKRIMKKIGEITSTKIQEIEEALAKFLKIKS